MFIWSQNAEVEVYTRFYSPTRPAFVDVALDYDYKTGASSVYFRCRVFYRIVYPVMSAKLGMADLPETRSKADWERLASWSKRRGSAEDWTLLFAMCLDDNPPGPRWYPSVISVWGLGAKDAKKLHSILFGNGSRTEEGDQQGGYSAVTARRGLHPVPRRPRRRRE